MRAAGRTAASLNDPARDVVCGGVQHLARKAGQVFARGQIALSATVAAGPAVASDLASVFSAAARRAASSGASLPPCCG